MSYPLQRKFKSEWPTPEEEQVCLALKDYCFDPEKTSVNDFTPTAVLYAVYFKYAEQYDFTGGGSDFPDKLNETQFGAALRRVFHLEEDRLTRRRVGNRRVYGYFFVKGPGSIVVNGGPGNPAFKLQVPKCRVEANTVKTDGSLNTLAPLALACS